MRLLSVVIFSFASIASAGSALDQSDRVAEHECHNAGMFAYAAGNARDEGAKLEDVLGNVRANARSYPNAYYATLTEAIVRYAFTNTTLSPTAAAQAVSGYCRHVMGVMSTDETTWRVSH